MLTLIFPYRNRDLERVKRSLDSLKSQTDHEFQVVFVDYGSDPEQAAKAQSLLSSYSFASYNYMPYRYQPWNKSRALNSVIRDLDGGYGFVADIDMIFHPEFIATLRSVMDPDKAVYFKVGFLSEEESKKNLPFNEYQVSFYSDAGATGLTLFPVEALKALRGFDEFYHFWGSEDSDVHVRLKNAGHQVAFYEENTLLLHQWHVIYRNKETRELTEDLQLSGIVQINYQHLLNAGESGRTVVNPTSWGGGTSQEILDDAEERIPKKIQNSRREIDVFLFGTLPALPSGVHLFEFVEKEHRSPKNSLKRLIGKRMPSYYDMKSVNDRLLLHLIGFYRDTPFSYQVDIAKPSILLKIAIS